MSLLGLLYIVIQNYKITASGHVIRTESCLMYYGHLRNY
jgi:hypothetical protein